MRSRKLGKISILLLSTLTLIFAPSLGISQSIFPNEDSATLISSLRTNYYPTSVLSYNAARDTLYGVIDLDNGVLTCVYSGLQINFQLTDGDPSTVVYQNGSGINAEHSWPQSFFDEASPMVSDMHHLFPTWVQANGDRSNHPFAEIDDNSTAFWYYNGTKTASKPSAGVIDLYSEYYNNSFEPREDHKGNLARAMFYFWTMYATHASITGDVTDNQAFFDSQKDLFYQWHKQDPVDQDEIDRSNAIAQRQGTINPFVHDTSLVRRAYFYIDSGDGDGGESEPVAVPTQVQRIIISQYYEGASNNKWIEITNTGQFDFDADSNPLYIHLFANPSSDLTGVSPTSSLQITGTVRSGQVLLYKNSSAVLPSHGSGTNASITNFNGNDPIILSTSTGTSSWADRTDVFGDFSGSNFAININYTRKRTINTANTTWTQSEWFTSANSSVDAISQTDSTSYLGNHRFNHPFQIDGTEGWRMISFPSSDQTFAEILEPIWLQGGTGGDIESSDSNLYEYDESTNSWNAITNFNTNPVVGKGYILFLYADDDNDGTDDDFPKLLSIPHVIVQSTVGFPLTLNGDGWNFLGNPYPTSMNWDSNDFTKTNISNSIYIWNASQNAYGVWNGATGTNGLTNGIIPAYQGFFVEATAGNPSLTVDHHVASSNLAVFKTEENQEIRLSANGQEAVILFSEMGEVGTDRFDARLPESPSGKPQLSLIGENSETFIIASLPLELNESTQFVLQSVSDISEINIENQSRFSIDLFQDDTIIYVKISNTLTSIESGFVQEFQLLTNYPNPFNPSTNIQFSLENTSQISLQIFDIYGRDLMMVANGFWSAGSHSILVDMSDFASGTYLYTLASPTFNVTKKMMLMK